MADFALYCDVDNLILTKYSSTYCLVSFSFAIQESLGLNRVSWVHLWKMLIHKKNIVIKVLGIVSCK